jgi:hypothetical protein
MSPNPPQFAPGSWTIPQHLATPHLPLPELVDRIPTDQPLVLRPRIGRFLTVFTTIYFGIPLAVYLAAFVALLAALGGDLFEVLPVLAFPGAIVVVGGLVQLGIVLGFGMSGGPVLAANTEGLWIRARKWPAKSVFLPWPAVARIYPRRWLWDRAVCVLPHDPRAGSDAGTWARLDMGMQKVLFGSRLTASAFYCGRRSDDVLAELHRLSGGRVPIG